MPLNFRTLRVSFAASLFLAASVLQTSAQVASSGSASTTLVDAPLPQIETAQPDGGQAAQQTQTQTPAPAPNQSSSSQSNSNSSSSSQSSQQPGAQQTQKEKAEEQLKQQETQRVAGVMATFNTTRNRDALPLSSRQKFQLFFKSAFDPWPFGLSAVVAGIGQAEDSTPEWGGGMEGYGKRFGAGYSDYFMGNFFGNAVLPSLLHEDPRYFQKGSGKPINRFSGRRPVPYGASATKVVGGQTGLMLVAT